MPRKDKPRIEARFGQNNMLLYQFVFVFVFFVCLYLHSLYVIFFSFENSISILSVVTGGMHCKVGFVFYLLLLVFYLSCIFLFLKILFQF